MKISKILFLTILLLVGKFSNAQKHFVIIDSITTEAVSFFPLKYNDKIYYSDKNGEIILYEYNTSDVINFAIPEYKAKRITISEINDYIYLVPNEILLEELSINILKQPVIVNTKSKIDTSFPIKPKEEILVKTTFSKDLYGYHIKKINATIKRDFITFNKNKETKNYEIYIRINFYDKSLNKIGNTDPVIFSQKKINKLEIDLKNKIEVTDEPIYLALEFIGVVNNEGKFVNDDFYLRPIYFLNELEEVNSQIYMRHINSDSLIPTYKKLDWTFKYYKNKNINSSNETDIHFFSFEIQ